VTAASLRWRLHTSDRSPTLEIDPHGEIISIDIERDIDILRMQIWAGRIMKTPNLATGRDEATNGVRITRPSFEPISR
jgi:hypothetical protein